MARLFLCWKLALAAWALSPPAWAGSPTVTALPTLASNHLDFANASYQIVKVADVVVVADDPAGAQLTVSSGSLTNSEYQTPIAFQVAVVSDGIQPTAGDFTANSGSDYRVSNLLGTTNLDLYIRYQPVTLQDPGTYSSMITLIVENQVGGL